MKIRPLQPQDDRAAIGRVYEESWKNTYQGIIPKTYLNSIPEGEWCSSIDMPGRYTLLLLDSDQIVGTTSYSAARLDNMKGYGEIISIYILPDYVGKGYGKALLRAAIDELRSMGFQDVFLWVLADNHAARRFYETFGFQNSHIHLETDIGGKVLREIQYTYHIQENM